MPEGQQYRFQRRDLQLPSLIAAAAWPRAPARSARVACFAFALWDALCRRLFLARDWVGKSPCGAAVEMQLDECSKVRAMNINFSENFLLTYSRSAFVHVIKNVLSYLPYVKSFRNSYMGSPFGPKDQDVGAWITRRQKQIEQILSGFQDAWGDWDWIKGKSILEIGSGADSSVPLCFVMLGASAGHVSDVEDSIDFPVTATMVDAITASLAKFNLRYEMDFPHAAYDQSRIRCHGCVTAENLEDRFGVASVDLIISTSVLEHVDNPELALGQMASVLSKGGRMIHAIAMGNHCCGRGESDRLGHLYYPDWIWSAMFSNRVGHNRLRWFQWESLFAGAGFAIDFHACANVDPVEINAHRSYLAKRFRDMSDDQLMPSYAVVCCTKI